MNFQKLAAQFGSPLYVYDLRKLRESHEALSSALPRGSAIYYSLKANPHPALVRELGRLGCLGEISSAGELDTVLGSGYRAQNCLYTGPGKTFDEIVNALRRGIVDFSVDSPHDVRKVALAAEQAGVPARILLRINPDEPIVGMGLTMTGAPSQFGADTSWVRRAPEEFSNTRWAKIVGFHIYMGTNISAAETLLHAFSVAAQAASDLAQTLKIDLEVVDLGGGFGHPYATAGERPDFSGLRAPCEAMLDTKLPGWRRGAPKIAFESGRYLTAGSGTLLATVQDIKISKEHAFVVLDTGIHHLGGMSGLRRVPGVGAQLLPAGESAPEEELGNVDIVGPLCTPLDYLARGVDIKKPRIGDIMAIPNVGAYGLTASLLSFLSRDTPREIVIDGGEVVNVSQLIVTRSTENLSP